MSRKNIICFDASIKHGLVGVGVWDFTNKKKVYITYDKKLETYESYAAETMALATAMEYAWKNKIKTPHLFTDNLVLAQRGIPKNFTDKFGDATLSWIPREFNNEADKLSKKGRNINKIPIESLVIPKTAEGKDLTGLGKYIGDYDKETKVNLMRRLAITPFQMHLVGFINKEETSILQPEEKDLDFIKFCYSIIRKGNIQGKYKHQWVKLIKKIHGQMNDKNIELFIRSRNLI